MSEAVPEALRLPPPTEENRAAWAAAERACLGFPRKFLEQARELGELRRQYQAVWEENERLHGIVVRSLVTLVENCRAALAEPLPADTEPSVATVTVASAERAALHLLEELGVHRVELLGRTYDDVAVDGEKVEDPFEILVASEQGALGALPVREVVLDLWVGRRNGELRIVQRGRVNC